MKIFIIKNHKKTFFIVLFVLFVFYVLKSIYFNPSPEFLNIIARFYFDKQYYLKEYPEVAKLKISPFRHYTRFGWKEDKNPNKEFNNNFYKNMYKVWSRDVKDLNPLQHFVLCKLKLNTCYTSPNQLKKAEALKNPKYYLALAAIFRDEARFLKEWIEFYKLMGVEHFYLYNHLSKDNFMDVLKPYIEDKTVELVTLTENHKNWKEWNDIQFSVYNDAIEKTRQEVEWLIVVDTDEFIFPQEAIELKSLLKKYDEYPSLSINFRFFGSGTVRKIEQDKLMIESLMMAEKPVGLKIVKTIVKPRYVDNFTNPHFAELKLGYAQVTENYEYFYGPFSPSQSMNIFKGNHYWGRDWEFFKDNKLSRVHLLADTNLVSAYQTRNKKINQLRRVNEERSRFFDDSIVRFVKVLRTKIFEANEHEDKK